MEQVNKPAHIPEQLVLTNFEKDFDTLETVIINKVKMLEILSAIEVLDDLQDVRKRIADMRLVIMMRSVDKIGLINIDINGDTICFRRDILISYLNKILEAQTIERAKYYVKQLKKSIDEMKTSKINDINLNRWKEYDEILTDSLWLLDKRDASGVHLGWYWGNFVPQIPHQLMLRYTKRGDWVLDTFVGSGTTLIECRRLGRNGIGIELNSDVAERARNLIQKEENPFQVVSDVIVGDSRNIEIEKILRKYQTKHVQLLIMHPPYHDIIKFSKDERDLSTAKTTEDFLKMFGEVVDNATPYLEPGRFFALVIGDKYSKGEWIPLGFYCMQEVLERGYSLKSIIVKNFEETRGKRSQKELWRYRALVGGFYIFKHEYIMLFVKRRSKNDASSRFYCK